MRILLANTGHPATLKGGAEAAVLDLGRGLAARGHHVALAVHHAGRTLEIAPDGPVTVYHLPNRNLYYGFDGSKRPSPARLAWHALDSDNPFMARAFGQVLDREKPDIVNTHVVAGLSQGIWRSVKRRGLPLVHYLHEYGSLCPRGSGFKDGKLCATPCLPCGALGIARKRLSRLVDAVVGVSRYTLQRHVDWGYFPKATRSVLPNAFDDLRYLGRPPRRPGPLRLGTFGRLIPDKGAHLLVEAAKRFSPEALEVLIAGSGDETYEAALRREAAPNVSFLGWSRAQDVFPPIDALVVPSLWPDPQPRVVFEAYAHGVPVIGARAGGIPEQIDEGRTGWLFEAGSADDLARVIGARLLDRAHTALREEDFAARLDELDPAKVLPRYEDLFAATLRARAPHLSSFTVKVAEHMQNR
ncbi:MAG TPA: glycosyltransferase family 4 protein [Beijerinckiaceae bacterium]|jgi:glycosyltransferase involved in cell wall biosynthesis